MYDFSFLDSIQTPEPVAPPPPVATPQPATAPTQTPTATTEDPNQLVAYDPTKHPSLNAPLKDLLGGSPQVDADGRWIMPKSTLLELQKNVVAVGDKPYYINSVTPGSPGRTWTPSLEVNTSEGTMYYVPSNVLLGGAKNTSGDQFSGSWFYPSLTSNASDVIQKLQGIRAPEEWGKQALSYGWGGVSDPSAGYLVTPETYNTIFAGGYQRVSDPNYYGMRLTGGSTYAINNHTEDLTGDDPWSENAYYQLAPGGAGTNTTTRNSSHIERGGFLSSIAPILQTVAAFISPIGAAIGNIGGKVISGQSIGFGDVLALGGAYLGSAFSDINSLDGVMDIGGISLPSSGLSNTVTSAVGNAALSGGAAALSGGDVGQAALGGALSGAISGSKILAPVSGAVNEALGTSGTAANAISSGINAAAGSAAISAVGGASFGDILENAAIAGLTSAGGNYVASSVRDYVNDAQAEVLFDRAGTEGYDQYGQPLEGSGDYTFNNTLASGAGGATAGLINAALTGGNVGTGILTGGLAGAAGGLASDFGASPTVSGAVQSVTGGLINSAVRPDPVEMPEFPDQAQPEPPQSQRFNHGLSFGDINPVFIDAKRDEVPWGQRKIKEGNGNGRRLA